MTDGQNLWASLVRNLLHNYMKDLFHWSLKTELIFPDLITGAVQTVETEAGKEEIESWTRLQHPRQSNHQCKKKRIRVQTRAKLSHYRSRHLCSQWTNRTCSFRKLLSFLIIERGFVCKLYQQNSLHIHGR